jgi:ankyrin repeat protein
MAEILPEIFQQSFERFSIRDLYNFALTSKYNYNNVVDYLFRQYGLSNLKCLDRVIGLGIDQTLVSASKLGYYNCVRFLIYHGANICADDDFALRLAAENGHYNVVELLIQHGAYVHADNDEALRRAVKNGHYNVVELLKRHM